VLDGPKQDFHFLKRYLAAITVLHKTSDSVSNNIKPGNSGTTPSPIISIDDAPAGTSRRIVVASSETANSENSVSGHSTPVYGSSMYSTLAKVFDARARQS
jgi:hypothetical protein